MEFGILLGDWEAKGTRGLGVLSSTKKEEGESEKSTDWLKTKDSETDPEISPPHYCVLREQ